jgi:hypothetical protein
MSVAATVTQLISAVETLEGNTAAQTSTKRRVTWDALSSKSLSLSSTSTPPVTKIAGGQVALVAGAKTLDLCALTGLGANGASVDMTGLKVQALYMENPSTNANTISIAKGASEGYQFSGSDGKLTLSPGQSVLLFGNDATPDVASGSAHNLDFAGTLVQPFNIIIVAG